MTDLITRARDQWCCLEYVRETVHGEQVTGYYSCPPEVVAALLDVLERQNELDVRMSRGGREALRALAAIAKALETSHD